MKKFIGNKMFYKMLIAIVVPIVLQQFITQFVSLLDNLMIGSVGNSEMTGVSLANQLLFVFNLAVFGALSGASIFASQFFGGNNKAGYQQTFRFKILIGLIIFIIATLIFLLFNDELLNFFINSKEGEFSDPVVVFDNGKKYLLIMLIGNLPFVIKEIYATSLREMKCTFYPMICGISAIIINLLFNSLLIFGLFFFPKLNVIGAAIATVISRFVEMGMIVIYTHLKIKKYPLLDGVYKSFKIKISSVKTFLPKTVLLLMNETLWSLGLSLILSCYALKGLDVVSSLNICNTVSNVFITIGTSMGNATAIILGAMLGQNKKEEAKASVYKILFFCLIVAILASLLMVISSFIIPNIYETNSYIKIMARNLIIIQAITLPFTAINTVCYFTLRSGGMIKLTMLFDSVFVMCIRLPIVFIICKYSNFNIYTIVSISVATDCMKTFVGYILVDKGIWLKQIV